jgi:hypothetical protein
LLFLVAGNSMHCRIERVVSEGITVLLVSGRLCEQHVDTLKELLEQESDIVAIDLEDVLLVDRKAVTLLAISERSGIELTNCPAYVREWVVREKARTGSGPSGLEASADVEDK